MIDLAASLQATTRQHACGMVKIEEDLARYERILTELQVSTVLELGTFSGKSAVWFAERVDRVVTIDVHPQVDIDTYQLIHEPGTRVSWITGSSVDPETVGWVRRTLPSVDLLVLDSDHSRPHVLAELNLYADLVRPGGALVVEDTILHWMDDTERAYYDGDPHEAVGIWLKDHPEFEIWDEIEQMSDISLHLGGWLRKVR